MILYVLLPLLGLLPAVSGKILKLFILFCFWNKVMTDEYRISFALHIVFLENSTKC